jgi:hypothetical protein
MATERLSMRHTREILRQKWVLDRTHRQVAQSLRISSGAVGATMLRAQAAGPDWPEVQALADDALEARLYGRPEVAGTRGRPGPDGAWIHAERRKPGVTLELLHLEYLEQHPEGYRYTQFCEIYRRWLSRRGLTMRQLHHAGDKCFVDYAGQKPHVGVDPSDETRKWVTVLERRTDACTTTPCLQPRIQGSGGTEDLGGREGESLGGRAPGLAQAAVSLVGPIRPGRAGGVAATGQTTRIDDLSRAGARASERALA